MPRSRNRREGDLRIMYDEYGNQYEESGDNGGFYATGDRGSGRGGEVRRDRPRKKKSGCKRGEHKDKPYITGWNVQKRRGMLSFIASPYKGKKSQTKRVKSSNGRYWENWIVKLNYKDMGKTALIVGMMEVATGRLIMKDIGMIANPKENYFGTMFRKDR